MKLCYFSYRLFFLTSLISFIFLPGTPIPVNENGVHQNLSLCQASPYIAQLLSQSSQENWANWIRQLSGSEQIQIQGKPYRITTRYSSALFSGASNAKAYDYVLQWITFWYPKEWIEEHSFQFSGETWKNIVLTIPGFSHPDEIILATAHLDSLSPEPLRFAPGAEDNASGTATLLEMARLFRHYRFDRTIRLIWFTGEEQGFIGSKAYIRDFGITGVIGVINFDMFGYDRDGDRCFEIHAGTYPASKLLSTCMEKIISTYNLDLTADLVDGYNMTFSDHAPFWDAGVPALEILENHFYNASGLGCGGTRDPNPYYHTEKDTIENISIPTGFSIAQAGIAAIASLAKIQSPCFQNAPIITLQDSSGNLFLRWTALENALQYRVIRANSGCHSTGIVVAETPFHVWEVSEDLSGFTGYTVEAIAQEGCTSFPSPCVWRPLSFRQHLVIPTKR